MTVKATFFCAVLFFYFACILCILPPLEPTLTVGTPVTPNGETSDFFSIGDTAQLTCTVNTLDVGLFLVCWRILGATTNLVDPCVSIVPDDPLRSFVINVTIDETSTADDYECFAVSSSGNLSAVFTININPFFTVTPDANVLITNGNDPGLTCEAEGVPTPDVQLVRISDGAVLSQGSTSVSVPIALITDEGDYQCIANTTGADQAAVFNFTVMISQGSDSSDVCMNDCNSQGGRQATKYELLCCDPVNLGSFIKFQDEAWRIRYISCQSTIPDWCPK